MQSARIRTAWKRQGAVSTDEHAAAVAAAAWRIAITAAKNLHAQAFHYATDQQRLAVLREYLYFFIHAADRTANHADHADRAQFITALSQHCERHYRENEQPILAAAADAAVDDAATTPTDFITELNHRSATYATTRFPDAAPGYDAYRHLATHIQTSMGADQTNKWVQAQVIELDGPEAHRVFSTALAALNHSATRPTSEQPTGEQPTGN